MSLPNGQSIVSTALTPDSLLFELQKVTAQLLGLDPQSDTDTAAYSKVRLEWLTNGQPDWKAGEDIVFLSAREEDSPVSRTRDLRVTHNDGESVTSIYTYTRVWRVSWRFYGPNSFERARTVNDALYLDWTHDTFDASRLYLVDAGHPQYAPEIFSGLWWKRTDLSALFNEAVTASVIDPTMASAEVLVFNENGQLADINS